MLPQWHVKDPGQSAKSAGDRLHLNTHTALYAKKSEWADYAVQSNSVYLSGKRAHTRLVNERSATVASTERLWTDLGSKSGAGTRELIFS